MKISVITSVFNSGDTLAGALDSVLDQTWPDVELIVVDGGSTDGTQDVLAAYRERIDVLISEADDGMYDALNKGILHASGDVVGFMHADDVFADRHVLDRLGGVFSHPDVDAVYGDLVYVSRRDPGRIIRLWKAGRYTRDRLRHGWMPPHPTFYVRRHIYARFGAFDTSYRIAADYDCMLRLLGQGRLRCRYIPEVLVRMRTGGASNRSLMNILRKSGEDYRALRQNNIGGVYALLCKNLIKLPQFLKHN